MKICNILFLNSTAKGDGKNENKEERISYNHDYTTHSDDL